MVIPDLIRRHGAIWCSRVAALLAAVAPVHASDYALAPYDFSYRISGDRAARPVQVFDNGADKTYFQFPDGATVPLILVDRGPDMALPVAEGPYHTVRGLARAYTLVLASRTARVEHASIAPAAAGHAQRAQVSTASNRMLSSHATPIRGDVISWAEPERQAFHDLSFTAGRHRPDPAARALIESETRRLGPGSRVRIHVSGLTLDTLAHKRVAQVRERLVEHGVERARIAVILSDDTLSDGRRPAGHLRVEWLAPAEAVPLEVPAGVPSMVPDPSNASAGRPLPNHFDILATDRTVSTTLQRWARQAGHRLKWESSIDAPVTGDITLDTLEFAEAANRVVAGLRASGYPLQLQSPSDRVWRVVENN